MDRHRVRERRVLHHRQSGSDISAFQSFSFQISKVMYCILLALVLLACLAVLTLLVFLVLWIGLTKSIAICLIGIVAIAFLHRWP
jgi:hypothetical protein